MIFELLRRARVVCRRSRTKHTPSHAPVARGLASEAPIYHQRLSTTAPRPADAARAWQQQQAAPAHQGDGRRRHNLLFARRRRAARAAPRRDGAFFRVGLLLFDTISSRAPSCVVARPARRRRRSHPSRRRNTIIKQQKIGHDRRRPLLRPHARLFRPHLRRAARRQAPDRVGRI